MFITSVKTHPLQVTRPHCTANLPDPVASIDPAQDGSPQDHFNTVLYTGNGSTQSITGVGFQPDLVWIKRRNIATNHNIFDSIRGANVKLYPNLTNAEYTDTNALTSFDSDGFSLGADGEGGSASGSTYVSWNWNANGSGVSNTDGSITSTVSANTDAGFSIVSYTGNGSSGASVGHGLNQTPDLYIIKNRDGASVGHGLNQTPDLYIIKNRDAAEQWWVSGYPQMSSVFSSAYKFLSLDRTDALITAGGTATTATSTTITFTDSGAATNEGGSDMVCYAFHSVDGFSKFGSYTGNGQSYPNTPFIYTGFRPAFVLYKRADTATSNWWIQDSTRSPYNLIDDVIYADLSNAEGTNSAYVQIDFLSNGFKIGSNWGGNNGSGNGYIYMAFAEMPTKYSLAR